MADDAAGIVAADVERGGDQAVLNRVGAGGEARDSRRVVLVGGDGACHFQVTDGGAVDAAEGGQALLAVDGKCGGDGVAVAEEGAAEGLVVAVARMIAHRSSNADVAGQLHVLAIVVVAAVDVVGKISPFVAVADGVGVARRAGAGEFTCYEGEAEDWPDTFAVRLKAAPPTIIGEAPPVVCVIVLRSVLRS